MFRVPEHYTTTLCGQEPGAGGTQAFHSVCRVHATLISSCRILRDGGVGKLSREAWSDPHVGYFVIGKTQHDVAGWAAEILRVGYLGLGITVSRVSVLRSVHATGQTLQRLARGSKNMAQVMTDL
jgi:hypothetical protein